MKSREALLVSLKLYRVLGTAFDGANFWKSQTLQEPRASALLQNLTLFP
jgi:hypothetical protein